MPGFSPRRSLRGRFRLLVAAGLLLIFMAVTAVAALRYLQVDETELPDLLGMPYDQAAAILREENLVPRSYPENVQGVAVESVTSQTPPPGAVVRRGRTIAIGVNRPPEAARAPVLLGLTEEQAGNTARAVSLSIGNVAYVHAEQPAGRVVEQRPGAGELVSPSEGIAIVVSRGPDQRTAEMPDLMGVELNEARRRLTQRGVRSVEAIAGGVSFASPGTVVTQEPAAGETITPTTPVILSYNLSAREVVPVPDLVGQSATLAGRRLRAAGLQLGKINYREDPELPPEAVIETTPSGYTLRGIPVVLTVNATEGTLEEIEEAIAEDRSNDGQNELSLFERDESVHSQDTEPGGDGRRITVTFDPATLGVRSLLERDYDLRLVVQDDEGERTVIDRRVRAGEAVSAVVVVHGDALLQTFINGVFFQAWRP